MHIGRYRCAIGFIAPAAVLWAGSSRADAPMSQEHAAFSFRPGVVVSPARDAAFVMSMAGGIAAVDLSSGRELWQAADAVRPLCVIGHELIAQARPIEAPRMDLVAVNLDQPTSIRSIAQVALPDDVRPIAAADPTQYFTADAIPADGALLVHWEFESTPLRGQADRPSATDSVRREGTARVDLRSGEVSDATAHDYQAVRDGALPDRVREALVSGRLSRPVQRAGGILATFERTQKDGMPLVVLHRWSATGEVMPLVELSNEARFNARYASADERHLLISGPAEGGRWRWRIFDLATAKLAAEVLADQPGAWFFLNERDGLLIHEHRSPAEDTALASPPNTLWLRALDLKSGAERWKFEVRDTRFRGVLPPAEVNGHAGQVGSAPPGTGK
jgi:hypothetical protein